MREQLALFAPTDVNAAHDEWGANCGPCALAAVLGRQVNDVRGLFEGWPGYTNPTLLKRAIERAGHQIRESTEQTVHTGLGFVQFEGPWERGGTRAAYRHTHWVGLARRHYDENEPTAEPVLFVYDTAAGEDGGWVQTRVFRSLIVPMYLADEPKATGWRFRQVLEVSRA